MSALKTEWTADRRKEEFQQLRPFLEGNSERGEQTSLLGP